MNEALKHGLAYFRVVLQWKGFMSWLFLSEASQSPYDDESNPRDLGCEDRMVLAALLSPQVSALQQRQCFLESGRIRNEVCTWLQRQPGGNCLITGFKK